MPKFYRDAFEQGVLGADRRTVLRSLFFSSSSPLRNEADNGFLRELRGRYDMVLQLLAKHPGCTNADIEAAMADLSGPGEVRQVGGYLKILSERYRMIERRLPIFAPPRARSGRYYIRDNFLRAWLSALQRPVSAVAFRPVEGLIDQADERLAEVEGHVLEGHVLEGLVGQIYEERSRRGMGDFPLSERIQGYWDRSDVEIDLVAMDGRVRGDRSRGRPGAERPSAGGRRDRPELARADGGHVGGRSCGGALYKATPHAIIRRMRPMIIIPAPYSGLRWRKPAA